ncbi:MAG: hypothetical protein ACE5HP_06190 [Gemmatimonadota bacterium]
MSRLGCPDTDALVTLSAALGWSPLERLAHLATCPECRVTLSKLEELHGILAEEAEPAPGLPEEVLASLTGAVSEGLSARRGEDPEPRGGWRPTAVELLNGVFAALVALGALAFEATAAPLRLGTAGILLSTLAGVGVLVWNRVQRPARQSSGP